MTETFLGTKYIETDKYPFKHFFRLVVNYLDFRQTHRTNNPFQVVSKLHKINSYGYKGLVDIHRVDYGDTSLLPTVVSYKRRDGFFMPKALIKYTMPENEFKEQFPEESI